MRCIGFFILILASVGATAASLREVRVWDSAEGTRVVFELDRSVEHQVFRLSNPERIVVDLPATSGARKVRQVKGAGSVRTLRAAEREDGSLRVVLDMAAGIEPNTVLISGDAGAARLIVDLSGDAGSASAAAPTLAPVPVTPEPIVPPAAVAVAPAPPMEVPVLRVQPGDPRPVIVAIDAGHGGEDPGAIGGAGLQEKDVALILARKLATSLNAERGFRAVLTRDGDYYLPLRERINRARKAQADLFVSVHANAVKNRAVRGSAVYVVSPRGATTEHARWLAQKENAADLVGGLAIENKDNELAAVLIDLSQSSTMEASFDVGARLLRSLGVVNTLQHPQVQQAAFVVLKAPDIPSVLVETAFITNPEEERMLRSPSGQDSLVRSMLDGIKGYFASYRPREDAPRPDAPRLQKVRADAALN